MKKTISRILLSVLVLSSMAMAEESGVILGVGGGYGNGSSKFELNSLDTTNTMTIDSIKVSSNAGEAEILAGYKYFFTPSLGLRAYGNLSYTGFKFNMGGDRFVAHLINYGVNADFLYNFLSGENYDLGLFAGLGAGGNSYVSSDISNLRNDVKEFTKLNQDFFDMWLNIGLRTSFYKYFGFELGAKVPFMTSKMINFNSDIDTDTTAAKLNIRKNYSINARVMFSF